MADAKFDDDRYGWIRNNIPEVIIHDLLVIRESYTKTLVNDDDELWLSRQAIYQGAVGEIAKRFDVAPELLGEFLIRQAYGI